MNEWMKWRKQKSGIFIELTSSSSMLVWHFSRFILFMATRSCRGTQRAACTTAVAPLPGITTATQQWHSEQERRHCTHSWRTSRAVNRASLCSHFLCLCSSHTCIFPVPYKSNQQCSRCLGSPITCHSRQHTAVVLLIRNNKAWQLSCTVRISDTSLFHFLLFNVSVAVTLHSVSHIFWKWQDWNWAKTDIFKKAKLITVKYSWHIYILELTRACVNALSLTKGLTDMLKLFISESTIRKLADFLWYMNVNTTAVSLTLRDIMVHFNMSLLKYGNAVFQIYMMSENINIWSAGKYSPDIHS